MPKFERKPDKVEAWRTKGNRSVSTSDGPKKAFPGQWIVEAGNGLYIIMDDADFREKYDPKDKEAIALLKGELKSLDEEVTAQGEKVSEDNEKSVADDSDKDQKAKAADKKPSKK